MVLLVLALVNSHGMTGPLLLLLLLLLVVVMGGGGGLLGDGR